MKSVGCNDEHAAFVLDLFERHRAGLLRHVTGLLGTRTDAEDIVQETCTRLLDVGHLEHDDVRARSYMYRVATNLCHDRHRRAREQSLEDVDPGHEKLRVIDGPETIVDLSRALEGIAETLVRLKPRCRRVFLLRAAEGLSYEAIAESLGVSKRTVEREMKHALDACERRLRRSTE